MTAEGRVSVLDTSPRPGACARLVVPSGQAGQFLMCFPDCPLYTSPERASRPLLQIHVSVDAL